MSDPGDIVSLLADPSLELIARRDAEGHVSEGMPTVVSFGRHLLSQESLCSAEGLFGASNLNEVLDKLQAIVQRKDHGAALASLCFDIVSFIRAYFPQSVREKRFYSVAADISRLANMDHATRFYDQQAEIAPVSAPAGPELKFAPIGEAGSIAAEYNQTYALPGDLVRFAHLPPVELIIPPFITGLEDASFLLNCGIVRKPQPAEATFRVYGFRVNGFGDSDWNVNIGGQRTHVAEKLYRINFEALRKIIDAGSILILDMTAEGPYCLPDRVALLNSAFADLGIPDSQILLLTQNLAFEKIGKEQGLRATCGTAHYYLKRGSDIVNELYGSEAKMLDYMHNLFSRRAASVDAKKYACLNYTPRWPRWATVLSLFSNNHLDEGFVSFPGVQNKKLAVDAPEAHGIPNIKNRAQYLSCVPALLARCPLIVDVDSGFWPAPDFVFPTKAFENSYLHIVTETEMTEGMVQRVTEKILKPIVGLQPFLVVGNPGSLRLMRNLGFRTFDAIIDEDYDSIAEIPRRFDALESEMLRLLGHDISELRQMTDQVTDIVVHNFVHLVRMGPLIFGNAVEARIRAMISKMKQKDETI